MLGSIIAILGGIIAASPLIISKKPNAKDLINKITPYQGGIGLILLIMGILGILHSLTHFSIINLAVSVIEFIVGFLLSYSLISKYLLEKNETAKEKGEELRVKLIKYQVPAGITLAILGVLSLIL